MKILAVFFLVVLAGCASRGERHAAQCSGYGFTAGTVEYSRCLMEVDLASRARGAAITAGAISAQGARDAARYGR